MNIEDVIRLLSNRLREFKLSRNYATMSGDLERIVMADKEIVALEDTLFKLNLLVDTSKSAVVKETTLTEVITDGSVGVLGEYDITPYATDPLHERKIMNILSTMGVMDTAEKIEGYIRGRYLSSPVTGEMVMSAALAYNVDARLMMAIMEQDSRFGTLGIAMRTLNPGNVGNDDSGNIRTYGSWQEGVTAVAEWLSRHRGSTSIPETPLETVLEPTATTAPTTPIITTSTTTTSSTTPVSIIPALETIPVATSTPTTATTTPVTTIPIEEPLPIITSTTTTSSTTPVTATTMPATTTPSIEPLPIITSTTTMSTITPMTATSTPTN